MTTTLELLDSFLPLLSEKRFSVLPYWKDVGQVIFNLLGVNGFKLFVRTSSKHGKTKNECESAYSFPVNEKISIKTLAFYAREDSPSEYKNWEDNMIISVIEKSNGDKYSICNNILKYSAWLDYFFIGEITYIFNGVCLKEDRGNLGIKEFIYQTIKTWSFYDIGCRNILIANTLENISNDIESFDFIENLRRVLNFNITADVKLDSNQNKIATKTSVITRVDNDVLVLGGKPEDYITMKLSFDPSFEEKHKAIDLLSQIFPNSFHLNEFLKVCSSFLEKTKRKRVFRFVGQSLSGKSTMTSLIEDTLECYAESQDYNQTNKRVFIHEDEQVEKYKFGNNIVVSNFLKQSDIEDSASIIPFTEQFDGYNVEIDKRGFLSLLIEYYPIYKKEGFHPIEDLEIFMEDDENVHNYPDFHISTLSEFKQKLLL